jgi:hypothetical protein
VGLIIHLGDFGTIVTAYFYHYKRQVMKKLLLYLSVACACAACGKYRYYPTPIYAPAFANAFEVQANTNAGIHGFSAGTGLWRGNTIQFLSRTQLHLLQGMGDGDRF